MISAEARPGQGCIETAKIAEQLKTNFMDMATRKHLASCVPCLDTLEKTKDGKILTLVRNIRNGVACAG